MTRFINLSGVEKAPLSFILTYNSLMDQKSWQFFLEELFFLFLFQPQFFNF